MENQKPEINAADDEVSRLRKALLRIATEGDALSGEECQEIAAEGLGIPVPPPPRLLPPKPSEAPRLPSPNCPSSEDMRLDGVFVWPADLPADAAASFRRMFK
jgi:hypothetical protein